MESYTFPYRVPRPIIIYHAYEYSYTNFTIYFKPILSSRIYIYIFDFLYNFFNYQQFVCSILHEDIFEYDSLLMIVYIHFVLMHNKLNM